MARFIISPKKIGVSIMLATFVSACSMAFDAEPTTATYAQQPYYGEPVSLSSMIVGSKPVPGAITMPITGGPSYGAFDTASAGDATWHPSSKSMLGTVVMPLGAPEAQPAFASNMNDGWAVAAMPAFQGVVMPLGAPSAASGFDTGFSSQGSFAVAAMPTPRIDGLPLPPPAAFSAFGAESGLVFDARSGYFQNGATAQKTASVSAGGVPLAFVGKSKGDAGEMERKFRAMINRNLAKYGFTKGRSGAKGAYGLYCTFVRKGDPVKTSPASVSWRLKDPNGRTADLFVQELKLFPGIYDMKLVPAISGLTEEVLHRFAARTRAGG